MMRRLIVIAFFLPAGAFAQGTIGGQGFGYPAGQLGARAAASAGSLAPFDAVSSVNPATIAEWPRKALFFHLEPEFRATNADGRTSNTRTSRFPLAGLAERVSKKVVLGLTFSTYLDRTWETVATTRETVGTDTAVDVVTRYSSSGAINDVRVALGWTFSPRLRLGAAYHAYTGENRLRISWDFSDDLPFGDVSQTSTLAYGGSGLSAGTGWNFAKHGTAAGYARWGGEARMRVGDTLVATARMPDHLGAALQYDGIKGTLLAGGWERVSWSALRGLGSSALAVRDADKLSVGGETQGPMWRGTPVLLRLGVSRRTLPFDALGDQVHETTFSFGTGLIIAKGLGNFDLAVQRAGRSAGGITERSWIVTFGLAIRP
jgi:hypothetical protein